MSSKHTIKILQNTADRFDSASEIAIKQWQNYCGCEAPGRNLQCANCPYFRELVLEIQSQVNSDQEGSETQEVFPCILPLKLTPPYPNSVKQQCIDLYRNGYSLQRITELTGVYNLGILRKLLKEAGFVLAKGHYPEELKQRCLKLYLEGSSPHEVEEATGVSADTIRAWIYKEKIGRPKNHYSPAQREEAISLYSQNKPYEEILERTGVPKSMVKKFAHQAKAGRKRVGRPPVYSVDFRHRCLKMFESGMSAARIAEAMDVATDTVRAWKKESEEILKDMEEENEGSK